MNHYYFTRFRRISVLVFKMIPLKKNSKLDEEPHLLVGQLIHNSSLKYMCHVYFVISRLDFIKE